MLSANLYAPIPLPMLDVFAKAGAARVQTTGNASASSGCPPYCLTPSIVYPPAHIDYTETRFAYGAGAQLKLAAFAIRLEYQRIAASLRDPALLSVGLSFTF